MMWCSGGKRNVKVLSGGSPPSTVNNASLESAAFTATSKSCSDNGHKISSTSLGSNEFITPHSTPTLTLLPVWWYNSSEVGWGTEKEISTEVQA